MSAADKAAWILSGNLLATRITEGRYTVRLAGTERTASITWHPGTGRLLIDGEDIELDERAWGLSEELGEIEDGREVHLSPGMEDDEDPMVRFVTQRIAETASRGYPEFTSYQAIAAAWRDHPEFRKEWI